jgi:hypothetical protein
MKKKKIIGLLFAFAAILTASFSGDGLASFLPLWCG